MALQRIKWSAIGADFIRTQARDGAIVRGLDDPPVVHRRGLPAEAGFRDRGVVLRGRDQEGRNRSARIYGLDGAGYSEEDPDKIFTSTGDANAGGPGELEAGKAFEERMARAISPSSGKVAYRGPASLRG